MTKILVIEDNPTIRKEVLTWLLLEDYEAVGASNGREGVEIALEQLPDLVVSDIMMPEKDGYRVLLELRTQPTTALTPFIFMTAKQEKIDIRHGMALGADDYITKPFAREEFLSAIQTRLARRDLFAQQSERKVRDLLHMLPHELRTPLVGILGVGELLEQDAKSLTPAEITEYAEMITSSGWQLHRLIENHLLYIQLETYTDDPQNASIAGGAEVEQVAQMIRDTSEGVANAYGRIYDLQLDLQPGAVHMLGKHLTKLVHELVDNAFKFSNSPATVRVMGKLQAGKYILSVSDQGRGMSPENIARIGAYVQFERATYEQQGSGLGLTIARQLAEMYGGSLQVESTVGAGTVIHVALSVV